MHALRFCAGFGRYVYEVFVQTAMFIPTSIGGGAEAPDADDIDEEAADEGTEDIGHG